MAALKCSNSILVRGVYIDAEGPGSVDIPINYVKLHFERERKKKSSANQKIYSQSKPNLIIKSPHDKDREAQSSLIEKPTKSEIKIQSGMDATQLV